MLSLLFAPAALSTFERVWSETPNGLPLTLCFRPITPQDQDAFVRAYAGLSERSRRLRFFGQISSLSSKQLDFLTHPDGVQHLAWGAFHGADLLAVGRMVRRGQAMPEVALTVVDAWQGRGLGLYLHAILHRQAAHLGIRQAAYDVSEENDSFRHHLRELGAMVAWRADGMVHMVMPIYRRAWRIPKNRAGQRFKRALLDLPTRPEASLAHQPARSQ